MAFFGVKINCTPEMFHEAENWENLDVMDAMIRLFMKEVRNKSEYEGVDTANNASFECIL